jgi:hypothetical protein
VEADAVVVDYLLLVGDVDQLQVGDPGGRLPASQQRLVRVTRECQCGPPTDLEPPAQHVPGVGEDPGLELHYVETGAEEATLGVAFVARRKDAVDEVGPD